MMPQMPSREKLLAWIDQVSFADQYHQKAKCQCS